MNNEFKDFFYFALSPSEAIANLLVALLCGALIAILYRITYKGVSYSTGYVVSLIMLTLITALVIMVIGNNLARAFGLVGAMSIIRFRTAIKDTQDIMFIFFALAIGLASGSNMYSIALIGTIFIGLVILIASWFNNTVKVHREYLLQIVYSNTNYQSDEMLEIIKKYCKKHKLINIKKMGESDQQLIEHSYYIILKNINKSEQFISDMNKLKGVSRINLFFDET